MNPSNEILVRIEELKFIIEESKRLIDAYPNDPLLKISEIQAKDLKETLEKELLNNN